MGIGTANAPSGALTRSMTNSTQNLGGRLPLADPATLIGAQRELFERVQETRVPWAGEAGIRVTAEDGRLIGPFNGFLLKPEVATKFLDFTAAAADHRTLSPRVREVVIVAVGAVWEAEYELYAHTAMARQAGLSDEAVTTLAAGGIPEDLSSDERIAARVAHEMSAHRRIDNELYREAERAFGRTGLFDLIMLMGQYHTVSILLNLFEVPAP
jgi:4-carboxymuconolactone decarboxylase